MWFFAILLFAGSLFLVDWAVTMQNEHWDIMTIPSKMLTYIIPIGFSAITCIVWCNLIL